MVMNVRPLLVTENKTKLPLLIDRSAIIRTEILKQTDRSLEHNELMEVIYERSTVLMNADKIQNVQGEVNKLNHEFETSTS